MHITDAKAEEKPVEWRRGKGGNKEVNMRKYNDIYVGRCHNKIHYLEY